LTNPILVHSLFIRPFEVDLSISNLALFVSVIVDQFNLTSLSVTTEVKEESSTGNGTSNSYLDIPPLLLTALFLFYFISLF